MTERTETVDERARRIVAQEVRICLSSLIGTLAPHWGAIDLSRDNTGLSDLFEQAGQIASAIPDYEEAARYEGWKVSDSGTQFINETDVDPDTGSCAAHGDFEGGNPSADDWQYLCDEYGIDPYYREVFEHWAVSDWLADKLEAKGEKVDRDFAGLTVWARTTTGQAIYCDGVFQDIARDLIAATAEA